MNEYEGNGIKTVAFVPIKTTNERLPYKNTRQFYNGKTMLEYILNTLKTVHGIDEIYVYCSDQSIKRYLSKGIKFLEREKYYDLQSTSFNDVLSSFAAHVPADIYVLAHATAPFVSKKTFSTAIEVLKTNKYDSAFAVVRKQDFVWSKGRPINYCLENIPRTQDLEPFYLETCGMYAYTSECIYEKNRRIGDKPFMIEVAQYEACDVNDLEDFKYANILAMGIERYRKFVRGGGDGSII